MQRPRLNFFVDLLALLAMLLLAATGILVRYILPPGSRSGYGLTLWGLDRHQWGDIHFWGAVALIALLILHVALHWDWVCAVLRIQILGLKKPKQPSPTARNIAGGIFLIAIAALVAGFIGLSNARVSRDTASERPHRGRAHTNHDDPGIQINGRMTLNDVAEATELDSNLIKAALGLPPDTPDDERLGRLRQRYNISMSDIRAAVAALMEAKENP